MSAEAKQMRFAGKVCEKTRKSNKIVEFIVVFFLGNVL